MKKFRRNKKGFTLVEIIVVLVIMGILLAIAVPSVLGYVGKAQDQQYIAEARNAFLGANTIIAKENATQATTRSLLKAADINKEIGETDLVKGVKCTLGGSLKKVTLTSCDITLTSKASKTYTFTTNKEVTSSDTATVDDSATYPAS